MQVSSLETEYTLCEYPESELSPLPPSVNCVFMLPIRAELEGLRKLVRSLSDGHLARNTAILVLVNHASSSPAQVEDQNKEIVAYLKSQVASGSEKGPYIRFAYSPNRKGRVHFGKLRQELIICGKKCRISPGAICFLHDADTAVNPKMIVDINSLYKEKGWSANVANHDLSPLSVTDAASSKLLGGELDQYNKDLLLYYDLHRLVDAIGGLYHLMIEIDEYHTNTPAISATFATLSGKEVSDLLAASEVAEDYALAGWLRKKLPANALGNYGRVLYGGKVRLFQDTHHGDAEERAYYHGYIRGGGISADYNPITDTLEILAVINHKLPSLIETAKVFQTIALNHSPDESLIKPEDARRISEALFLDIPQLLGLNDLGEFSKEVAKAVSILSLSFLSYRNDMEKYGLVKFQDEFRKEGDRYSLVGINKDQQNSTRGNEVLGAYLTQQLVRERNRNGDLNTALQLPKAHQELFAKLHALGLLLARNADCEKEFIRIYDESLVEEEKYENKVLEQRAQVLREIITNKRISLEQARPFAEVLGSSIRQYFAGSSSSDTRLNSLPKQYVELLSYSDLHKTLAQIGALRKTILRLKLAVVR